MQSYERYALVALLFLVVLVTVVALWDDGSKDVQAAPMDGVALVDETGRTLAANSTSASRPLRSPAAGSATGIPISGQDERERNVARASTRRSGAEHGVEPSRERDPEEAAARRGPARAQSPEELQDLPRTVPIHRTGNEKLAIQGTTFLTSRRPRQGGAAVDLRDQTTGPARRTETSKEVLDRNTSAKPRGNRSLDSAAPKTRTYIVRSGDALRRIAKRELDDEERWVEIAALNGLADPDKIFEDMELLLPARSTDATNPAPGRAKLAGLEAIGSVGTATLKAGEKRYVMAPGETLSTVLERELGTYRRSIELVVALNPGMDPDRIRAGQSIVLPNTAAIPPAKSKAGAPAAPADRPAKDSDITSPLRGTKVAAASTNSEFVVR